MKKFAIRVCKLMAFALVLFCSALLQAEPPSMGQIDKMQQDIQMEQTLRTEVEKGKKVYIKKVVVKGVSLINEDKMKEIILPFHNHWLTQSDINLILDSIANAYKQNGYEGQPEKITFQVKDGYLEINAKELKH